MLVTIKIIFSPKDLNVIIYKTINITKEAIQNNKNQFK